MTVRHLVAMGGADAPVVGLPTSVVQDGAGNYVVQGRPLDRKPPLVFDSRGRFRGSLGSPGQGPGDVTPVRWITTDSLGRVEVYSSNRISVFGANQAFVHSTATSSDFDRWPWRMTRLDGGRSAWLTSLLGKGPDLAPITFRGPDGRVSREVHLPTGRGIRPARAITRAVGRRDGAIWLGQSFSIKSRGYELVLLDTAGTPQRRLDRTVEWWWSKQAASPGFTPLTDTVPTPFPSLWDIHQAGNGMLLVLLGKPRADWTKVPIVDRWLEGNYSTVLEAVDPVRAQVVGSVEVRGFHVNLVTDTRFATYREDPEGLPWIDIWEIAIR